MRHLLLALVALLLIASGLWPLLHDQSGLKIAALEVGSTPITLFEPIGVEPAPAVVIAHGFAGSQQLMQSFAVTLAQAGYVAVTFDFPGHGRNPAPLEGGLADPELRGQMLRRALEPVVAFARELPSSDGRIALLGHSMATDVIVHYAQSHAEILATVAVSPFSDKVTERSPPNLLVIYGANEPANLQEVGRRIVAMAADGEVAPDRTYGHHAQGTARRLVLADGVEHTGVVFSGESLEAARDWLDATFNRQSTGEVAGRGPALALLFLGLVLLARPLVELVPRAAPAPIGAGAPWRRLLPSAIAPAVLTPLLLWAVPGGGLPILLGDYLVLHFGLYGLLTVLALWLTRPRTTATPQPKTDWRGFAVATTAVAAYVTLAMAVPVDRFVTAYLPLGERAALVPILLVGTLSFFLADEWLTRGPGARRGAYPLTKGCFLVSLVIATLLNLSKLFFLAIIAPVMLIFFIVYGLFSRWAYRRTNHPLVGGIALALAFAWGIAATFPIVAD